MTSAVAVAAMQVGTPVVELEPAAPAVDASVDPVVASMAPGQDVDPESLMPRWRS